ncbi:hypothetical protein J6590_082403 [Homalodisca vitripennis]|nr:hypothetical protein J6590_082403 [Homalodisca vitripennis]
MPIQISMYETNSRFPARLSSGDNTTLNLLAHITSEGYNKKIDTSDWNSPIVVIPKAVVGVRLSSHQGLLRKLLLGAQRVPTNRTNDLINDEALCHFKAERFIFKYIFF